MVAVSPFLVMTFLVAAFLVSTSLAAQNGLTALELRPGVVIDPGADRAFLANERGHLEAVSLTSGEVHWSLDQETYKPLASTHGALLVQTAAGAPNGLSLMLVDGDSGRVLRQQILELPSEVRPGLVDQLGGSFHIEAQETRSGTVAGAEIDVIWRYNWRAVSGSSIAAASERIQRYGALRVDTAGGAAVLARPLDTSSQQFATPAPAAIELDQNSKLKRIEGRQFRSADGQHVLASTRIADHRQWQRYRWQILDKQGQHLGELRAPVSYTAFTIAGGLAFYTTSPSARRVDDTLVEQAAMLHAVDLTSGTLQWQRPIRDTDYRGPFPP